MWVYAPNRQNLSVALTENSYLATGPKVGAGKIGGLRYNPKPEGRRREIPTTTGA
jgi:hypothetical protein